MNLLSLLNWFLYSYNFHYWHLNWSYIVDNWSKLDELIWRHVLADDVFSGILSNSAFRIPNHKYSSFTIRNPISVVAWSFSALFLLIQRCSASTNTVGVVFFLSESDKLDVLLLFPAVKKKKKKKHLRKRRQYQRIDHLAARCTFCCLLSLLNQ